MLESIIDDVEEPVCEADIGPSEAYVIVILQVYSKRGFIFIVFHDIYRSRRYTLEIWKIS
jgi:hypothetical protein